MGSSEMELMAGDNRIPTELRPGPMAGKGQLIPKLREGRESQRKSENKGERNHGKEQQNQVFF